MQAVAYAAPETALAAEGPETGTTRDAWPCPECLAPFHRSQPHQLFCCHLCKNDHHQRWRTRGAMLAPLQAAARATRGGTRGSDDARATGARARRDAEHIIQRWKEEDAAANQGKGRMPIERYMAERYRLGLVEVA